MEAEERLSLIFGGILGQAAHTIAGPVFNIANPFRSTVIQPCFPDFHAVGCDITAEAGAIYALWLIFVFATAVTDKWSCEDNGGNNFIQMFHCLILKIEFEIFL